MGGGRVSAYKRNNIKLGGREPSADGVEDPATETIRARRRRTVKVQHWFVFIWNDVNHAAFGVIKVIYLF